jgi:hypothetical protein
MNEVTKMMAVLPPQFFAAYAYLVLPGLQFVNDQARKDCIQNIPNSWPPTVESLIDLLEVNGRERITEIRLRGAINVMWEVRWYPVSDGPVPVEGSVAYPKLRGALLKAIMLQRFALKWHRVAQEWRTKSEEDEF